MRIPVRAERALVQVMTTPRAPEIFIAILALSDVLPMLAHKLLLFGVRREYRLQGTILQGSSAGKLGNSDLKSGLTSTSVAVTKKPQTCFSFRMPSSTYMS